MVKVWGPESDDDSVSSGSIVAQGYGGAGGRAAGPAELAGLDLEVRDAAEVERRVIAEQEVLQLEAGVAAAPREGAAAQGGPGSDDAAAAGGDAAANAARLAAIQEEIAALEALNADGAPGVSKGRPHGKRARPAAPAPAGPVYTASPGPDPSADDLQRRLREQRLADLRQEAEKLRHAALGGPGLSAADASGLAVSTEANTTRRRATGSSWGAVAGASAAAPRRQKRKKHVVVEDAGSSEDEGGAAALAGRSGPALVETTRDRLIRTGVITPFAGVQGFEHGERAGATNGTQETAGVAGAAGVAGVAGARGAGAGRVAEGRGRRETLHDRLRRAARAITAAREADADARAVTGTFDDAGPTDADGWGGYDHGPIPRGTPSVRFHEKGKPLRPVLTREMRTMRVEVTAGRGQGKRRRKREAATGGGGKGGDGDSIRERGGGRGGRGGGGGGGREGSSSDVEVVGVRVGGGGEGGGGGAGGEGSVGVAGVGEGRAGGSGRVVEVGTSDSDGDGGESSEVGSEGTGGSGGDMDDVGDEDGDESEDTESDPDDPYARDDAVEADYVARCRRELRRQEREEERRRREREEGRRRGAGRGSGGGDGGRDGEDGVGVGASGASGDGAAGAGDGGGGGEGTSGRVDGNNSAGVGDGSNGGVAPADPDPDVTFDGGLCVPHNIWSRMFDYQRTGLQWMWELHTQRVGGILGDEMGLGKTVQVAAFLGSLHHSGLYRPSLVVAPATVLRQWMRELHRWYPVFRVYVMHDSMRTTGEATREAKERLLRDVLAEDSGIVITTYEHVKLFADVLLPVSWGYVVLDEGHKIRNPDADVTVVCKQMRTVHRLLLSGSPIQNSLVELWSLFDFVFPGRLGTLPVFTQQFVDAIQSGGYVNASKLQVATAYRCAVVLRDLIAPYLLRRLKSDVSLQLPDKTEHVLFCQLTPEQRAQYLAYLGTSEVARIVSGELHALAGIGVLRKICNHPDLLSRVSMAGEAAYGDPERSGKLRVTARVLQMWAEQGHRALVFTQTQQMLDILEKATQSLGLRYMRMDGNTAVRVRARMVDVFNSDESMAVFLLTTRVGGLGVNLTGADRVLLYDPDWNPMTDVQARERAWRVGQRRQVTIYRLITSGTIEEKIYHRQVYKQYLTSRVLKDPRQRRFFQSRDLKDLFTLGDTRGGGETHRVLKGVQGRIEAPTGDGGGDDGGDGGGEGGRGGSVPQSEREREGGAGEGQAGPSMGVAMGQGAVGGDEELDPQALAEVGGTLEQHAVRGTGDGAGAGAGAGNTEGGADAGVGPSSVSRSQKDDARVLRELFEGRGIGGALDHNAVEAGAVDGGGARVVEAEAARAARAAAQALRESRRACGSAPVSTPTWTGRTGAAGRFGARRRAGTNASASGSSLLQQMRERRARDTLQSELGPAGLRTAAAELAGQLARFLAERGGRASSAEVAEAFQGRVGADHANVLRECLRQVAELRRSEGGGKAWVLRDEFT